MSRVLLVLLLFGPACGGSSGEVSGTTPDDEPVESQATNSSSASSCPFRAYAPSSGCYLDDVVRETATISDAATLAQHLRPYPAEANRPPCDPAGEAARFDFARERIFVTWIDDADGNVPPEPTRVECAADATRVVVSVDRWCGGTERSPGRLLVIVPAGSTPIEIVNEGNPDCPSYGGGDPPP